MHGRRIKALFMYCIGLSLEPDPVYCIFSTAARKKCRIEFFELPFGKRQKFQKIYIIFAFSRNERRRLDDPGDVGFAQLFRAGTQRHLFSTLPRNQCSKISFVDTH